MYTIYTTSTFDEWFEKLKDHQGKRRIQARIDRVEDGHFGDYKQINEELYELRFFFNAGYRVYFCKEGQNIIILLAGGNKSTQGKDIQIAMKLITEIRGNPS